MGLLDDLKQQAGKQQTPDASTKASASSADSDFYPQHVKARMLAAYKFLNELVNQLNDMKLETRAEYPFKPDGKPVILMQQDYKAYNDSITDPRQITLSFRCALVNPTSFDVNGRAAVLAQSERLDRFRFKYEKVEQKDGRQMVTSAHFKLVGPLPIKIQLQVDEQRQVIKLLMGNVAGPGVSQHHLKPEQLDEAFLDHLGKYILRQETTLFKEELSADLRAKLRQRLQAEQKQRETELKEIEAARQAEEALRKQNSTTAQLRKAVSQTVTENTEKLKKAMKNGQLKRVMHTQVAKGKDSLKGIFNKLKKPTQASEQIPPAKPAQSHQQPVAAKNMKSAQISIPAKVIPPGAAITAESRVPAARADVARSKPANTALAAAGQTKIVKKTAPPKVYNAPPNNPFLKPESPVAPSDESTSTTREMNTAAAVQPARETTPVANSLPRATVTAKTQKADPADGNNVPSTNPFLKSALPIDAAERKVQSTPAPLELEATMVIDISNHPELTAETLASDRASGHKAPLDRPSLKPESPAAPPVDASEQDAKAATELTLETIPPADIAAKSAATPALSVEAPVDAVVHEVQSTPAPLELEATMVIDISNHPELTAETLAPDRASEHKAPLDRPSLKPESPAAPPVDASEQDAKTATELTLETIPPADIAAKSATTPVLSVEPPVDAPEREAVAAPLALESAADVAPLPGVTMDSSIEPSAMAVPERDAEATPLAFEPAADVAPIPDVTMDSSIEPSAMTVPEREAEAAPLALESRALADSSNRPVTPESLEADLARIIEGEKQNKRQQTEDKSKTATAVLQTPSTKLAAQAAGALSVAARPSTVQTAAELNASFSEIESKTNQVVDAKDTIVPASKNSAQTRFPGLDELDLDIAANLVDPENNDSKGNS